jgi:predicted nucleic acid-binding protein
MVLMSLAIEMIDAPGISINAFELAKHNKRPNTYDTHYLALALHLGCSFWTGDERFYNAVKGGSNQIFYVGNYRTDQR